MATVSTTNKLHGKVAIVTGGASGIGEATARRFADYGAHAVVIADVQDDKGKEVANSIGLHRSTFIHCDVSKEEQVKSLVEATVEKYGRLDVMFSNAGVHSSGDQTVLDFDLSSYERLFSINVRGAAACVKHAGRAMIDGGIKGSIICTASTLSTRGIEKYTDYVMSKSAVVSLAKSASLQLGASGIRVNTVSPGVILTPMASQVFQAPREVLEQVLETTIYLKKGKLLEVEHVAEAVSFLASEESEFITGLDMVVDGGYVHPRLQ
ncbi:hypothetical protein UlMin_008164 [Ulmus minor]